MNNDKVNALSTRLVFKMDSQNKSILGFYSKHIKKMLYNHKTNSVLAKYILCTLFSVWDIKKKYGIDPLLKWEIVKGIPNYVADNKFCILCMEKKIAIIS